MNYIQHVRAAKLNLHGVHGTIIAENVGKMYALDAHPIDIKLGLMAQSKEFAATVMNI
jgi:hypothetical protein